jgi:hypothetical protein
MPNDTVPFVAVVGGFLDLNAAESAEAQKLAKEIGAALADVGFGLVVYYSDAASLDPHVVSGYVSASARNPRGRSIRVRFAESQRGDVVFAEQTSHPDLFDPKLFPGADWEAPFYRSLVAMEGVEAVLLMAGGRSTLIAGQIAVARKLPVLAIDRFVGSARVIWTELARETQDYPSTSTHTTVQSVGWLKSKCAMRTSEREQARRLQELYASGQSETRKRAWTVASFLALLISLIFGLWQAPAQAFYPLITLAGLVTAGATGALVRSVIWGSETAAPGTSCLLGSVAGFVVGLAYLIPQWVGAHGFLEASARPIAATDKIQFVSAVLVAISAGVGFDTVFTRLKREAEQVPVTVSR